MNILDLYEAHPCQFNLMAECGYRIVKKAYEAFVLHSHEDFHELYFVLSGKATHDVNGAAKTVSRGDLVFVRKWDLHNLRNADDSFEFINLTFTEGTLTELFRFLGEGLLADSLMNAPLPPTVKLTDKETDVLYMKFAELNTIDYSDWAKTKFKVRVLLMEIFSKYFHDLRAEGDDSEIPFWLENAYDKMKKPKNFIAGKDRFFELCGMTREHAARSLKRWYGVTPSEYVSDLRLSYAAGLLIASDFDVMDICYECGFQNVSWFYKAFTDKFGVTPAKYRQKR